MIDQYRGLSHLNLITAIAPMLGLLATIDGVLGGLTGTVGEISWASHRQYVAARFAIALCPLAWSLLLSIFAKWCQTWLRHQVDALRAQI